MMRLRYPEPTVEGGGEPAAARHATADPATRESGAHGAGLVAYRCTECGASIVYNLDTLSTVSVSRMTTWQGQQAAELMRE